MLKIAKMLKLATKTRNRAFYHCTAVSEIELFEISEIELFIIVLRGGSRIFSRGGGGGRIFKKLSKILMTFF